MEQRRRSSSGCFGLCFIPASSQSHSEQITNICILSVGCPTWHGDTIVNQSSDVESQEVKLLERKIKMLKFA